MSTLPVTSTIKNIIIAGGGTSGWMTAALMARSLNPAECRITVIEPPGPRGIGVGEASIPSLLSLLRTLRADEFEMMQRCEATYKLGIRFRDWVTLQSDHWHPFGVNGARIDGRDLFQFWFAERKRTGSNQPYHEFSLHWAAAVAGRGPHSAAAVSHITKTRSYAFHFNAEALAGWLRDIALASGIHEISGSVAGAVQNEQGDVTSVTLKSGETVPGEFFVDCTGFQSALMNKVMQDPFQNWNDQLLCDRAVAFKIEGKRSIPPFTVSQAMPSGWMWQIPLANHVGLGYVYSSQFVTDDEAWSQLQAATTEFADSEQVTPRFLKMRVGRQTSFWKNNVLAIGLSAGFLEPLESSGIHLSQVAVELFLELFPTGSNHAPARTHYNARIASIYDEVRDFVQMHYWLSQRKDTPFWIAARNAQLSPALKRRMEMYDDSGALDLLLPEAFPETSYYHLLAGSGRLPRRASSLALTATSEQLQNIFRAIHQQNEDALRDLPLHEELLDRIHRQPVAMAS